jgi:hypothetical protein
MVPNTKRARAWADVWGLVTAPAAGSTQGADTGQASADPEKKSAADVKTALISGRWQAAENQARPTSRSAA